MCARVGAEKNAQMTISQVSFKKYFYLDKKVWKKFRQEPIQGSTSKLVKYQQSFYAIRLSLYCNETYPCMKHTSDSGISITNVIF